MTFWKNLLNKLRYPKRYAVILNALLTVVSATLALLSAVFPDAVHPIVAYVLYGVAALSLAYSVYRFVLVAPKIKNKIKEILNSFYFTRKLMQNYGFKTVIFATVSLFVTLLYSIYHQVLAIWLVSIWNGALFIYYLALVLLRAVILFRRRKKNLDETQHKILTNKIYRGCGIAIICLVLALSGAILMMVRDGKGFTHPGLTIYAAAAYTFYRITMSIINAIKAKRHDDATIKALRHVGFAHSLVALL
ncbi:MAG: hypothetical protein IKD03_04915, partial [Clostridia bacterium]|nr:hypothetical protein [Clostridia bacterium]